MISECTGYNVSDFECNGYNVSDFVLVSLPFTYPKYDTKSLKEHTSP